MKPPFVLILGAAELNAAVAFDFKHHWRFTSHDNLDLREQSLASRRPRVKLVMLPGATFFTSVYGQEARKYEHMYEVSGRYKSMTFDMDKVKR